MITFIFYDTACTNHYTVIYYIVLGRRKKILGSTYKKQRVWITVNLITLIYTGILITRTIILCPSCNLKLKSDADSKDYLQKVCLNLKNFLEFFE